MELVGTIYLIKSWLQIRKEINEEWSWGEPSIIEGFFETMAFIMLLIGILIITIPFDIIFSPLEIIYLLLREIKIK